MFQIFFGLTPFIFITVLGFIFGKIKIFDLSHAKVLNLFLFYIAVPALIIKFVAQSEIGQIDLKQIISYFLMQGSLGLITFLITSNFFKRPVQESIIWSLMVALSNHVTLLLPITKIYFGTEVITQVTSIILMDSIILLSVITFFLELTTQKNIQVSVFLRKLFFNPMITSIVIGVVLFSFKIDILDTPIDYILSVLAACVSPIGLFAIGITLSFYSSKVLNKITATISILKLIISPIILLFIGFVLFDVGVPEKIPGAFFVSVAPCGHTAIVLCSAYNVNPENIVKALFISTLTSVVTIFFAIQYLTL
ncbi:AEC family transporter [Candidatus Pelagibacter sp.]|uniref:AEC family transporter n=1 Tax=Candidatus Pelagibacter sp. TaxID=2024849 RepID=UPI003F8594FE